MVIFKYNIIEKQLKVLSHKWRTLFEVVLPIVGDVSNYEREMFLKVIVAEN